MARFDSFSQARKRDPFSVWRAVREEGSVAPVKFPIIGRVYLAATWDACSDFLKGAEHFAADGRNAGKSSSLGLRWAPRMMRADIRRPGVRHAGYGGGIYLARVETEVGLERLLLRWPAISLAGRPGDIPWLPRPGMRGPLHLPLEIGARVGHQALVAGLQP